MSSNYPANYFREQSTWRDATAVAYPNDPRNAQSAAALRSLAEFVESDEREAVKAVDALEPFAVVWDQFMPGEEGARAVSRYGYGYPVTVSSHQEFLAELVALCVEDVYDRIREGAFDEDPTNTLYDFEIEAAKDNISLAPHYFRRRTSALPDEMEGWVKESRGHAEVRELESVLRRSGGE